MAEEEAKSPEKAPWLERPPQRYVGVAWHFVKRDLWRIRAKRLSRGRGFLLRLLRVVVLAARGFRDDKCQLRASALTFYSLLSIVPALAMVFGVATGFGLEKNLEVELAKVPATYQPVIEKVVEFSKQLLKETRSTLVAGIGVLILFYTVIKVLSQIESSFNDIWGIRRHRSFGRKLADYLMAMVVAPLLLIVSSSATVFIGSQVRGLLGEGAVLGPMVGVLLRALPWAVVWLLFTFVYVFMPNTKVRLSSAVIAGVVAGSTFQIMQWGMVRFGISVSKYNAIYGVFSALPLFLVFLQLGWLVLLFGAEVSFSWQNVDTYEFEHDCLNVSRRFKRLMALLVTRMLVRAFDREEPPLSAAEISHRLEMPIRLVNAILFELSAAGIVTETRSGAGEESAYQAARPLERYTVKYVLDAIDGTGTEDIPVAEVPELARLRGKMDELAGSLAASPGNAVLKDL